jgi:hypothetical protein
MKWSVAVNDSTTARRSSPQVNKISVMGLNIYIIIATTMCPTILSNCLTMYQDKMITTNGNKEEFSRLNRRKAKRLRV